MREKALFMNRSKLIALLPSPRCRRAATDALSLDEEDSESVCSSQDGSVLSEEGGGAETGSNTEEDLQFVLSEHIDNLGDKR